MSSSESRSGSCRSSGFKLGLGFVIAYLLLMLLWVPVHWAYPQLQLLLPLKTQSLSQSQSQSQSQQPPQLPVIQRLQGTLWQGSAEQIELPVELRLLSWQWDPRALLSAALGYRLTLDLPQNQAWVAIDWDRSVTVSELLLDGRLSDWVSTVQGQSLPLDVDISARLDAVRISAQGCTALQQGQLSLQNWQGLMSASLNRIGRIDATLDCVDDGLQVDFKGQELELQLSGRWLLGPDLRYLFTAEAHPQTVESKDSLRGIGFVEQHSGVWQFVRRGRL